MLNPYLTKFSNIEGELSTTNGYIDRAMEKMNSIEELFNSNSKKSKYDELIERFT